jgi:hypothetical protein
MERDPRKGQEVLVMEEEGGEAADPVQVREEGQEAKRDPVDLSLERKRREGTLCRRLIGGVGLQGYYLYRCEDSVEARRPLV